MGGHVFGAALRRERERSQLTQEGLAHRSGMSVRTLRDIENGRVRRPRRESLRLLADALGLTGERRVGFEALARGDTGGSGFGIRPVPRQLPCDAGGFAGRLSSLGVLDSKLVGARVGGEAVVVCIAGMAGVGKTALAVHWAHRVATEFPDGQFYVDLRGHSRGAPMPAIDALGRFLRALGVPADRVPVEVDEAAALYRSSLAGRRVLVILDNAASSAQVRPLLPGSSTSFVLITSRTWLAGLIVEGASGVRLGVLPACESAELLSQLIGPDRMAAEPQTATRLADLCAHLPLALRIVAANLAGEPRASISQVVQELAADNRLDVLQVPGEDRAAVLAAFDLSYRAMPLEARRMFRLFGVAPGYHFSADAAAALAGVAPREASATLNTLADAHLIEQVAPGRYGLHDLLRLYARQRAVAEDPERTAAVQRLYDWYLEAADAAASRLYTGMNRLDVPASIRAGAPSFTADGDALSWLDVERHNLMAAVVQAADGDWKRSGWLLADAICGYFGFHGSPRESVTIADAAMTAADDLGDVMARGATRMVAAMAYFMVGDLPRAAELGRVAVELNRAAGNRPGEATSLVNLGRILLRMGDLPTAGEQITLGLAVHREDQRPEISVPALSNLLHVYREMGRLADAEATGAEAIANSRGGGPAVWLAIALDGAGDVAHEQGRLADAIALYDEALAIFHRGDNRAAEAVARASLAAVSVDLGHIDDASQNAEIAHGLADNEAQHLNTAFVWYQVGSVWARLGRYWDAEQAHQLALSLIEASDRSGERARALVGLSIARLGMGALGEAERIANDALTLSREVGYRVVEGQALVALAEASLAAGRSAQAAGHASRAMAIHAETGHRLGEARALVVLGRAVVPDEARCHWAAAHAIFARCAAAPEAAAVALLLGDPVC
jgi:tetratricopeptide (TPR) repeat protein